MLQEHHIDYYGAENGAETWAESIRQYRQPAPQVVSEGAGRHSRTVFESYDPCVPNQGSQQVEQPRGKRIATQARGADYDILTGESLPGARPRRREGRALGQFNPQEPRPEPAPQPKFRSLKPAPREDIVTHEWLDSSARQHNEEQQRGVEREHERRQRAAMPYTASDPLFSSQQTLTREASNRSSVSLMNSRTGGSRGVDRIISGDNSAPDTNDGAMHRVTNLSSSFEQMNHDRQEASEIAHEEARVNRAHPARWAEVQSRGYDVIGQPAAAPPQAHQRVADLPAYTALSF